MVAGHQDGDQPLPQRIQRGQWLPGNRRLDGLQHPFARIDLGAIGWLKNQHHIRWHYERLRGMTPGVVHEDDMQVLRVGAGKIIKKLLHHCGIQAWKFHEMTRVGGGFNRAKDPRILKAMLIDADRFAAPCGDALAPDRVEPEAAFISGVQQ